jgi:hypothetical protein
MMKKVIFCALLVGWIGLRASAQEQAFVHEGEFGFNIGASQYFGDLNPNPRFNTPNIAFGAFFRKAVRGLCGAPGGGQLYLPGVFGQE